MRILVACEQSQVVTREFIERGHNAMSCDIEHPGALGLPHYKGDVKDIIDDGFDMLIGFPPCTHLAISGAKHFKNKIGDGRQQNGIDFFMFLVNANIPRIAIENPISIMSTVYKQPTQIIHPYYFGDPFSKRTCLWLKNLPPLFHAKEKDLFNNKITHTDKGEFVTTKSGKRLPKWYSNASGDRSKSRSQTFPSIARAMGEQWG